MSANELDDLKEAAINLGMTLIAHRNGYAIAYEIGGEWANSFTLRRGGSVPVFWSDSATLTADSIV